MANPKFHAYLFVKDQKFCDNETLHAASTKSINDDQWVDRDLFYKVKFSPMHLNGGGGVLQSHSMRKTCSEKQQLDRQKICLCQNFGSSRLSPWGYLHVYYHYFHASTRIQSQIMYSLLCELGAKKLKIINVT